LNSQIASFEGKKLCRSYATIRNHKSTGEDT